MKSVLTIATREFRDRLRSGWIVACALVWLGTVSLTSIFGLIQIGHIGVMGYERTAMSLLNLVQYLVPLMGLLVGHDLVAREREDRTLNLLVAAGVSRGRILLGKFAGGALSLSVPLVVGFVIAGTAIGFAARDHAAAAFLKMACSGVVLGIVFCGIGLVISTFCRTRLQALVFALLSWGIAVFAFDLVALGITVSMRVERASHDIEVVCDATHVNAQADLHSAFDGNVTRGTPGAVRDLSRSSLAPWLYLNPVDVFRVVNLPLAIDVTLPAGGAVLSLVAWIGVSLLFASWRLNRADL